MDFDINKIMSMLSNMDKKDLEAGMAKASEFLQNKDNKEVLDNLKDK